VRSEQQCLSALFTVTPWGNAFYITDKPDTGDDAEVFSPHPEQRFFTQLMHARSGDDVLDLGTGSGILLIEAARRGARGRGIDISSRALDIARANALLNGVHDRVEFIEADITSPSLKDLWKAPDVVISNPPFEPVPDGFVRPLHSQGGDHGTKIISAMLDRIRECSESHKPKLIQLVLFSLGKRGVPPDLVQRLTEFSDSVVGYSHVQELLRPIRLDDYLALNFGGGRRGRGSQWLERLEAEGYNALHLIFSSTYLSCGPSGLEWSPYLHRSHSDECFVLPLCSPKRSGSRGDVGEAEISSEYLDALVESREQAMAGQTVDLNLANARVQNFFVSLLSCHALFNGCRPLAVIEVKRDSDLPTLQVATVLDTDRLTLRSLTQAELIDELANRYGGDSFAANVCDAIDDPLSAPEHAGTTHLGWFSEVVDSKGLVRIISELAAGTVQRFVVVGPEQSLLTPFRQRLLANVLSELAGIAKTVAVQSALDNYSLAHPLKHRVGSLLKEIQDAKRLVPSDNDLDELREQVSDVEALAKHLSVFSEFLNLLFYSVDRGATSTLSAISRDNLRFAEPEPLDLVKLLKEVALLARPYATSNNYVADLNFLQQIAVRIEPFFKTDRHGLVRWKSFFYEEILYEVVINAITHNVPGPEGRARIDISCGVIHDVEDSAERSVLIIGNSYFAPGDSKWAVDLNDWHTWPLEGPTGLTFLAGTLRNTDAGKLFYRHVTERSLGEDRSRRFEVALFLQGLVIGEVANG
jgi:SAM-dependent methyltransferase